MKSFYLLIALILFEVSNSYAQVIIVQNGTTALATSTLDSAILLAQPNAYIYLPGNYTFSVGANITKRINLIGAGYNADSSKATGISSVSNSITFAAGSQFSTITGVNFGGEFIISTNNISLSRCKVYDQIVFNTQVNNIIINECILNQNGGMAINGSNSPNSTNVIIQKCILQFTSSYWLYFCNNFNFDNNIFLYLSSSGGSGLYSVNNCQFKNNIFTQPSSITFASNSGNNVFLNNLFIRTSFTLPGTSSNNIFNEDVNTMFVNAPPVTLWSSAQNYNLSPTSLGNNAGTDGTDIGIYGTSLPFKDGGVPFNPHFQIVNIPGSTGTNGQLNITIKAAAQQN